MKWGLRLRYGALLVALTTVIIVAVSATLVLRFNDIAGEMSRSSEVAMEAAVLGQLEQQGRAMAVYLADNLTNSLYSLDMYLIQDLVGSAAGQSGIAYVFVFDETGAILHDGTGALTNFGRQLSGDALSMALGSRAVGVSRSDDLLEIAAPIVIGSELLGGVQIGLALEPVQQNIATLRGELRNISDLGTERQTLSALLVAGALLLVALIVSLVLARNLSRPILMLSGAAEGAGRGEFDIRFPFKRSDEVGQLATALEGMGRQLNDTMVSKSYLDSILHSMEEALFVCAADGRIEMANAAAHQVLGYAEAQLTGRNIDDVLQRPGGDLPEDPQVGRPIGSLTNEEGTLVVRDGSRVSVLVSSSVIPGTAPKNRRFVFVARNITERKRFEEQIAETQKIESIREVTGGVAHEFNNLLQAIVGSLGVIERSLVEPGEGRRMVGIAKRASQRGADLTNRLLAYVGRHPSGPELVETAAFITEAVELLRPSLGEAIDLQTDLQAAWPLVADRSQFQTALFCLALNARDAMPAGGRIVVVTGNARFDARPQGEEVDAGDYVRVSVSDTGHGMAPDVIQRAFQPFFTTKAVGTGTGLGLSMVYGFVRRQCGGFVKITSELGTGTRVDLYFPRADDATSSAGADAPHEDTRGVDSWEGKALVVEDDEAVLAALVAMLESAGVTVIAAANATNALSMLQGEPGIDCVVSDVVMPGTLNGLDIAQAVVDNYPATGIVLISGYPEREAGPEVLPDKNIQVLHKPVNLRQLLDAIKDAAPSEGARPATNARTG